MEVAHFSSLTGERGLPFLDHQFAAIAREAEPEKHVDAYLSLLEGMQPIGVRYPLLKISAVCRRAAGPRGQRQVEPCLVIATRTLPGWFRYRKPMIRITSRRLSA